MKKKSQKKTLEYLAETPAARADRMKVENDIKLRSKVFGKGKDAKCPKVARKNWKKEIDK